MKGVGHWQPWGLIAPPISCLLSTSWLWLCYDNPAYSSCCHAFPAMIQHTSSNYNPGKTLPSLDSILTGILTWQQEKWLIQYSKPPTPPFSSLCPDGQGTGLGSQLCWCEKNNDQKTRPFKVEASENNVTIVFLNLAYSVKQDLFPSITFINDLTAFFLGLDSTP